MIQTKKLWMIAAILIYGMTMASCCPGSNKCTEVCPKAPDYADTTMWITVDGDAEGTGADVFYVVSTWEKDWITADSVVCHYADVWSPRHRERMAVEMNRVAAYMAPGNRFYAPFYRHATIEAFEAQNEDTVYRRTRLAMSDVCEAFDYFLVHRDQRRPLVIAGFSQGGLAVVELLKHMDDETYSQLAAAYVLGYKVTPEDTMQSKHIKAAQGETDTGVTICYNTVKDVKYIKPVIAATCMGINPVNWRTDATPATLHDTITVTLSPKYHVLVVSGYSGSEYKPYKDLINAGDIHGCEPWLYSECLKKNIAVRVSEWRKNPSCNGDNDSPLPEVSTDIMQVTERVMTYAAKEPERALEVIDSLRTEGLPDYQADLLRVRVYSQGLEGKMLDSAIVIGERLMELPVAKENKGYREDLLETLVNACRLRHDDERALRWIAELVALCHEKGEETEALRNEAEMGLYLTHVGRQLDGVAKIDSVINVLSIDHSFKFNELDALIIALKRKITVLKESGLTEQIIPIAHRIIDRLTDYEQHPEEYRDGTYREPSDEDRQGYIDFYRTQAYGFLAEAYARNGDSQKARECLEEYEQSDYGQTLDGKKMIVPTWCLLGETEKMEAMYEDLTTARFRDYEQKIEIERQKTEASLWHIIAWLVAMISLLLACFAIYYFLRHREEIRKNRILARQITEAIKYKNQNHPQPLPIGWGEDSYDTKISDGKVNYSPPSQGGAGGESASLFAHISQNIVREKLFLDPTFDRQAAIDYFHLTKERIGAAFSQGSDYASISDFINECRLEYAVSLLNDQPELPVSQVAQASGFSDANYFGRKFKERFGLSPSQYRAGNTPKPSSHS